MFPYAADIHLDPEDGVSLDEVAPIGREALPGVAVVSVPRISNFTDFRLLGSVPFLRAPVPRRFDTIFLPGTKSPIDDMLWLRSSGMAEWLLDQHRAGATIIGVCGGYQMMGEEISDPDNIESEVASTSGLGLLPVRTRIEKDKTTRQVSGQTPAGIRFDAYEIHMGRTVVESTQTPFAILDDGTRDGIRRGRAIGTYLHGALEVAAVLAELIGQTVDEPAGGDHDAQYDRLAEALLHG